MQVEMSIFFDSIHIAAMLFGCMVLLSGCSGISTVRQPKRGMPLEEFWDAFDWKDLAPAEQKLWGLLGWNKASWQGDTDEPASEGQPWRKLSNEERHAAIQLGYDKRYWDRLLRRKKN
ncbi:MAG: hypothetical protein D3924_08640 [Candidatus Electrothrix sp. AR4]|nr:hypothetical protein [Candidatus Electrothrix sp. AR4]